VPHSVKPVMTQSHVRKKSPTANLEFIIDDQLRDELRLENIDESMCFSSVKSHRNAQTRTYRQRMSTSK